MKRTLILSVSALLTAVAMPANAQDAYGALYGGSTQLDDASFSGSIGGSTETVDTDFDSGFSFGAAIGYTFASAGNVNFRGEIDLSFAQNDADTIDFSGNGAGNEGNVSGDIQSTRLFANVLADFQTGSAFTPYIGGGLGFGFHEFDVAYGGAPVRLTGDDESFSTQIILGASYSLNDRTSLFADARFIRDYDVSTPRVTPGGTATVEDDLDSYQLNAGIRFNF